MRNPILSFIAPVVALAAMGACSHDNAEPNTPGATSVQRTDADTAIDQIANARCDREVACNNVGGDKGYASRSACMDAMRAKGKDELRVTNCPGGVVQDQLNRCVADVRGERCSNPLDTLSRLESCATGTLCSNR